MNNILNRFHAGNRQLALLIDPDKHNAQSLQNLCSKLSSLSIDYVFVGGSLLRNFFFDEAITTIKSHSDLPVVIFPGSSFQVSEKADAILFLSLVSGRNPEYLIGQQVQAAPLVKAASLEAIPTAYLIIDGGKVSATSYITQTLPIPSDKPDLAATTALAAEMLGMKIIYLEAGSGAVNPVSTEVIAAVKKIVNLPLIVGGGIRSKAQIKMAHDAGADIVVVGTAVEENDLSVFID